MHLFVTKTFPGKLLFILQQHSVVENPTELQGSTISSPVAMEGAQDNEHAMEAKGKKIVPYDEEAKTKISRGQH